MKGIKKEKKLFEEVIKVEEINDEEIERRIKDMRKGEEVEIVKEMDEDDEVEVIEKI